MEDKKFSLTGVGVILSIMSLLFLTGVYVFTQPQQQESVNRPEVLGATEDRDHPEKGETDRYQTDDPAFAEIVNNLPLVEADETSNTFIILGGTRIGNQTQYEVAKAITEYCRENGCTAVFHTGNILAKEGIESIGDPKFETRFETPYQKLNMPFYMSLGSHDYWGCVDCLVDYSEQSEKWELPAKYYTATFPEVNFYVTDSQDFGQTAEQESWLIQQIENNSESDAWDVVIGHKALITFDEVRNGENWKGEEEMQEIVCDSADLYVSGTSFILEYFDQISENCPTGQISSGSGGVTPRKIMEDSTATFGESVNGFVAMKVSGEQIDLEFVNKDGQVIATETRTK
jgi:tartrate-resistant acid phosphatase type 5